MVALLTPMRELRMRKHLFHIFQLSCFCLTANIPELATVKDWAVDNKDHRCRLAEVIMPSQSYFSNVAGSVAVCITEACLDQYRELDDSFNS